MSGFFDRFAQWSARNWWRQTFGEDSPATVAARARTKARAERQIRYWQEEAERTERERQSMIDGWKADPRFVLGESGTDAIMVRRADPKNTELLADLTIWSLAVDGVAGYLELDRAGVEQLVDRLKRLLAYDPTAIDYGCCHPMVAVRAPKCGDGLGSPECANPVAETFKVSADTGESFEVSLCAACVSLYMVRRSTT